MENKGGNMRKECDFSNAELIIPPKDPNKTRICIRIDTQTLNWFRRRVREAGGGNYQTMMNDALKDFIDRQNIKNEIMVTDLIGTTGVVSGTVTFSTGKKFTVSIGELLVHKEYTMGVNKPDLGIKNEEDERKKYFIAA
jgi:hypothetical protein